VLVLMKLYEPAAAAAADDNGEALSAGVSPFDSSLQNSDARLGSVVARKSLRLPLTSLRLLCSWKTLAPAKQNVAQR
jgi:hypothetical protein